MQELKHGLPDANSSQVKTLGSALSFFFFTNWTIFVIQTKKVASNAAGSGEGCQRQHFKPTTKQHQQQQFKANRKEEDGI